MEYSLAILIPSLLALVLYLNTLGADFAYDDSRAIQKNQDLQPETPIINILYDDFWGTPMTHSGSHKSYRPICVLSFRLNYYLGELNPWGYHLGNVLLHVVVTALFTHMSYLFLRHTTPMLVSGLIFASHPIHTEAVAGVVGRADVGACLFFILSLLSYMKYVRIRDLTHDPGGQNESQRSTRFVYFGGTALMTTAGMLTKEQGVTVIAVCATYDLFVHNKTKLTQLLQFYKQTERLKAFEGIILLGLLGVSLVAFRMYFMGNKPPEFAPSDNPASDSPSIVTRFLTYMLLPVLNMWMLLCPRVLSFDWSMESIPLVESVFDFRNIFSVVFYSMLAYLAWFILKYIHYSPEVKRHLNGNGVPSESLSSSKHSKSNKSFQRQTSSTSSIDSHYGGEESLFPSHVKASKTSINIMILSLSILIFPFIPATNIFFYVGFVIAERVLYIPSMGICLLIGQGTHVLCEKFRSDSAKQRLVYATVAVLLAMYSYKTISRNEDWYTEENLYKSGVAVNPAKAWGNLANIYNSQHRKTEAEAAYRSALHYRGNMADVHYNLGILLQDQKRFEEAVESYRNAIRFRPKLSVAHLNLAILTSDLGNKQEAAQIYRHCADLDTSGLKDPRLHENAKISCLYNLGRLLNELGQSQESLKIFEEALERKPSYYASHSLYNMYGEVFVQLGRYTEAEHWYRESIKSKPDHLPAYLTMAKLFQKKGQNKKAELWFKKAKDLDPNDSAVDHHHAQYMADTGRMAEAATLYRTLAKNNHDNFEIIFNAANTLRQIDQEDKTNEAEVLFVKATLLRPNEATAHMNLGAMYHIKKKIKEAEKSYLRALELKPDDQMTIENLAKLRSMTV